MSFAGKIWRLLVGIKDGLVLLFMLLFFAGLFAALSVRPNPGKVHDGALLLRLDGEIVEEAAVIDPLTMALSSQVPAGQIEERDVLRALDAAATDGRIKAVVLDLSNFLGGRAVHMQDIADALDRVRAAKKPVLTFGLAYDDDGLLLAAHSSEAWVDPMGGAYVAGPGGENLYYKRLFDQFDITAHVYRVGTYKSAVEPYMLSGMSDAARENATALYGAVWEEWKASVKRARPKAQIDQVSADPAAWLDANGDDLARATVSAGLVDKIGDWEAFGKHVASIVGSDPGDDTPGNFAHTDLKPWLAANKPATGGKAIGVVTIAGDITDGDDGPGTAGGARIAKLLDDALEDNLAALVVRVDSPGGTVTGAETIRRAIMRQKAKGIPIVVSMANYAASGGYWVSTPADRIFAEPETITGSIGIFGVVPSFEKALAKFGIDSDGVRTTPLSGQPDILGGLTPAADAVLQKSVEFGYTRFIGLVAKSRGKTPEQIDQIGQGRVWDGGSARQIGLVDQFGGLDDAIAWAAQKAGLKDGGWHAEYLGSRPDPYTALIARLLRSESTAGTASAPHDVFGLVAARQGDVDERVLRDLDRLFGTRGAQAYCLECAAPPPPVVCQPRGAVTALAARLLGQR